MRLVLRHKLIVPRLSKTNLQTNFKSHARTLIAHARGFSSLGVYMTCFKPKIAKWNYFNKINEKTGEVYATKKIKFIPLQDITPETAFKKNTIIIPCGKCAGCLCDKANDWATRAYLESTLHKKNCFLTITYNNEHLPKNRSLCKEDIQKFFKKLRHEQKEPIKYLLSGEYGPATRRPH